MSGDISLVSKLPELQTPSIAPDRTLRRPTPMRFDSRIESPASLLKPAFRSLANLGQIEAAPREVSRACDVELMQFVQRICPVAKDAVIIKPIPIRFAGRKKRPTILLKPISIRQVSQQDIDIAKIMMSIRVSQVQPLRDSPLGAKRMASEKSISVLSSLNPTREKLPALEKMEDWVKSLVQKQEILLVPDAASMDVSAKKWLGIQGARPFSSLEVHVGKQIRAFDQKIRSLSNKGISQEGVAEEEDISEDEMDIREAELDEIYAVLVFFVKELGTLDEVIRTDKVKYKESFQNFNSGYRNVIRCAEACSVTPDATKKLSLKSIIEKGCEFIKDLRKNMMTDFEELQQVAIRASSHQKHVRALLKDIERSRVIGPSSLAAGQDGGFSRDAEQSSSAIHEDLQFEQIHFISLLTGKTVSISKEHAQIREACDLWLEYRNLFWQIQDDRRTYFQKFISALSLTDTLYREGLDRSKTIGITRNEQALDR